MLLVPIVSIADSLRPDFPSPTLSRLLHILSQTTITWYILCTDYILQSFWKGIRQQSIVKLLKRQSKILVHVRVYKLCQKKFINGMLIFAC